MAAKGGKRGRNAGQGTRKIAKSRWLTFAALIEHSQAKNGLAWRPEGSG